MDERRLPDLLGHGQLVQGSATPGQVGGALGVAPGREQRLGGPEHGQGVLLEHGVALDLAAELGVAAPGTAGPVGFEVLPAAGGDDLAHDRVHSLQGGSPVFFASRDLGQLEEERNAQARLGRPVHDRPGGLGLRVDPAREKARGILELEQGVGVDAGVGEKARVGLELAVPAQHLQGGHAGVEDVDVVRGNPVLGRPAVGVRPVGGVPAFGPGQLLPSRFDLDIVGADDRGEQPIRLGSGKGQLLGQPGPAQIVLVVHAPAVAVEARGAPQGREPGLVPDGQILALVPGIGRAGRLRDVDDKLGRAHPAAAQVELLPDGRAPRPEGPGVGLLHVAIEGGLDGLSRVEQGPAPPLPEEGRGPPPGIGHVLRSARSQHKEGQLDRPRAQLQTGLLLEENMDRDFGEGQAQPGFAPRGVIVEEPGGFFRPPDQVQVGDDRQRCPPLGRKERRRAEDVLGHDEARLGRKVRCPPEVRRHPPAEDDRELVLGDLAGRLPDRGNAGRLAVDDPHIHAVGRPSQQAPAWSRPPTACRRSKSDSRSRTPPHAGGAGRRWEPGAGRWDGRP